MSLNKKALFFLVCLFCSCAETRVYDHGTLVAVIQGDATNIDIRWEGGSFHVESLIHSTTTGVAYAGGAKLVGAAGTVAGGILLTH